MPSLTIPLTADPATPGDVMEPDWFVDTFFTWGSGNTTTGTTATAVADNTGFVGGTGAVASDDTTSYAYMNDAGWEATGPGSIRDESLHYFGRLAEAAVVPPTVAGLTVTLTAVVRSTASASTHRLGFVLLSFDDDGVTEYFDLSTSGFVENQTGDWQRFEEDITNRATVGAWSNLLAARALRVGFGIELKVFPTSTPGDGVTDLAYLALTVAWSGYPSPLRQHPRTDGLGVSSQHRVWPPSRGILRGSLRQGPGAIP